MYYTTARDCSLKRSVKHPVEKETDLVRTLAEELNLPFVKGPGNKSTTLPAPGWPAEKYRPCITFTLDVHYFVVQPASLAIEQGLTRRAVTLTK